MIQWASATWFPGEFFVYILARRVLTFSSLFLAVCGLAAMLDMFTSTLGTFIKFTMGFDTSACNLRLISSSSPCYARSAIVLLSFGTFGSDISLMDHRPINTATEWFSPLDGNLAQVRVVLGKSAICLCLVYIVERFVLRSDTVLSTSIIFGLGRRASNLRLPIMTVSHFYPPAPNDFHFSGKTSVGLHVT